MWKFDTVGNMFLEGNLIFYNNYNLKYIFEEKEKI